MNELIPENCPSCQEKLIVEGIHLVCKNETCPEMMVLKIIHWVVESGIDFFSDSSVRSLFNAGKLRTITDLYSLTEEDFKGVEGFAKRKIDNALSEIERTREMGIDEFVDKLGIDLVGKKAVNKLGITSVEELWAFNDEKYIIGQNIISYLKENKKFVEGLLKVVKIKKVNKVVASKDSKKVCMTGAGHKTRNELLEDIQAKGDIFIDRVSKETDILVCEDISGQSSKLEKARKLGVKLMSYEEYFS